MDNKVAIEKIVEKLKKIHPLIATPMYGGMCNSDFALSCLNLQRFFTTNGLSCTFCFLGNESLIPRARNYIANEVFLENEDFTHILWIDADIKFKTEHVLQLLMYDHPIVAAPYPMKSINWYNVYKAANSGLVSEGNANELAGWGANYCLNFGLFHEDEQKSIPEGSLVDVLETGTGFLLTERGVYKRMIDDMPEIQYLSHKKDEEDRKQMYAFYDTQIDPTTMEYLSEDFFFCRNAKKLGYSINLCPWINLGHAGTYTFEGDLSKLFKAKEEGGFNFSIHQSNKHKNFKSQKHQSRQHKD